MPKRIKTDRPDSSWLKRLRQAGATARTTQEERLPLLPLKKKLLNIGGYAVILPVIEEDFDKIMWRGELFRKYTMMRGQRNQCHRNSSLCWEANKDKVDLCTGYGLSKEGGVWRQHSWCVSKATGVVIETTVGRIAYFGFRMNQDESELFLFENE